MPSPHPPPVADTAVPEPTSAHEDPRWIAARDRYISEHGDPDETFRVRIAAAGEMRRIEREYEHTDTPPIEAAEPGILKAVALGHNVEYDPPAFSSVNRWTCSRCGQAVLVNGSVIYGSATTDECPERQA